MTLTELIFHIVNTFKYHVSCTDGKISVRIILIAYFSVVFPLTSYVFIVNVSFSTELSTAQARRQKELQDLLKMSC